ncbi:MAG: Rieske 2Fe-2S domain-containing protein [Bacteroidia bacterium]|nr:Rieske 2Fe-2S domain-containing protein [Bacteroidia bacterium]
MVYRVASLNELRPNAGRAFNAGEYNLALFLLEGRVYAIENLCPHQHIPVLSEGSLEGTVLTCPMHGWRYDITSGACVHASGRVKTFVTEIRDGDVYVEIDEDEHESWW